MTFPYKFQDNFERGVATGTGGMWASEVDPEAKLDVVSYKQMADSEDSVGLPWHGVYSACVDLEISRQADAYFTNATGFATSTGATAHWLRLMMYVPGNLRMEDGARFTFFRLLGATTQMSIGVHYNRALDEGQGTGRDYRLFCTAPGNGIGPDSGVLADLPLDEWFSIEVKLIPDISSNGSFEFSINGKTVGGQKGLTYAAITSAHLGVMDLFQADGSTPGGTTKGRLYFDSIIYATPGRIGAPRERFPLEIPVTMSGHIVVGPGRVRGVQLIPGSGTDAVLRIYDTDENETYVTNEKASVAAPTAGVSTYSDIPFTIERGLFAELVGAGNPRAIVYMDQYYMNTRENDEREDAFDYDYGIEDTFMDQWR